MVYYTMTKIFFITGTDTDVGKTIVSCALLKQANNKYGYSTIGYKPIATNINHNILNNDISLLSYYSSIKLKYSIINPFPFKECTSPDIASNIEEVNIDLDKISSNLNIITNLANFVIIEGAGGWLTPINDNLNYSDWVISKQLPVIMVVKIKLGCINHSLLTNLVIKTQKLNLIGWVANCILDMPFMIEYIDVIKRRLSAPLIGVIPKIIGKKQNKPSIASSFLNNTKAIMS
ncbi:MAG: dethiobiotin synthase [Candidatus Lightella neohaematopini]|nr:dethiobiotin synthase [Candidatus Lightella neohaematopini]